MVDKKKRLYHKRLITKNNLHRSQMIGGGVATSHRPMSKRDILNSHPPVHLAPENFSLLSNRNEIIDCFSKIKRITSKGHKILLNLEHITSIDLPAACLLISYMMDFSDGANRFLSVRVPDKNSKVTLLNQISFDSIVTKKGNTNTSLLLSRSEYSKNDENLRPLLNKSVDTLGDYIKVGQKFWPPICEIIINTHNHASDTAKKIPWFMCMTESDDKNYIEYCAVDIGQGIFESLNNSSNVKKSEKLTNFFSNSSQRNVLAKLIPEGGRSETDEVYRGQGLKTIYDCAQSDIYEEFYLFTNKAKLDLKNIGDKDEDSKSNLTGTIYYWKIRRNNE
jgi:hypothetical protein